jgi:hypothetical protein
MGGDERQQAELRELVLNDLRSKDDEARAAFDKEFGDQLPVFADATVTALDVWATFRDTIQDTNQNISSYKLFISGYTVASGALFRQVLEGVSLAFLCSAQSLTVLDRFLENKYSPNKAVADLAKHAKKVHVNRAAFQTLVDQYDFYHKYAHLTRLTIAAGANLSLGGLPNVGAHFDPGKLVEYGKEVRSRVSFAKTLPNFVRGVAHNVATW